MAGRFNSRLREEATTLDLTGMQGLQFQLTPP